MAHIHRKPCEPEQYREQQEYHDAYGSILIHQERAQTARYLTILHG
jgi:hypothetical protein